MYKVSVITPTSRRPELLKKCVDMFLAQDYLDKELLIGYEFPNDISQIDCSTENVFAWHIENMNLGQKRNFLCDIAAKSSDIIIHMDDDDYYAPDWISKSVEALIALQCDCTGLNKAVFENTITGKKYLWHYDYETKRMQAGGAGATLCYWVKSWQAFPFPSAKTGEERTFMANLRFKKHDYFDGFRATLHGANTISHTQVSAFTPLN